MIDLYFSPTPNGLKVRLFLEEAGLPYRTGPVRLSAGEQHGQEMTEHPNVGRWFESITTRPATKRVYDGVEDVYDRPTVLSPSARRVLFEQDAATTKCG
jgi:hypothetical protein